MSVEVMNGPLTTSKSKLLSPDLLMSEIDRRVVKVRPSSTPLDQISRLGGSRRAGSMEVAYYSVDTKGTEATVTEMAMISSDLPTRLKTNNDGLFSASETILVPEVSADGDGDEALVLYVVRDTTQSDSLMVIAPNGGTASVRVPAGSKLVRMGRAATELDVQTGQYQALPTKATNYCQIFKAQIEESTLQSLTNKEVGWTFSDQEEVAVIDMRMGMEKNFLFGSKAALVDPVKQESVMLTGGIWNQTEHVWEYVPGATAESHSEMVQSLCKAAFSGSTGSRRKVLLAGSELIDCLNRGDYQRVVGGTESVTHWGIDFTELHSKFGTLYVMHSQVFDDCGYSGNGMVIDPEYLTKYSFIPLSAERLDLKKSGQRNTDAVVITEASCLVLRHPGAHMKIVKSEE